MVTYFNESDLVSFGQYLLSKERKDRFAQGDSHGLSLDERLSQVHHADVANWKEDRDISDGIHFVNMRSKPEGWTWQQFMDSLNDINKDGGGVS